MESLCELRPDHTLRGSLKIPRTRAEVVWESRNPGLELHAVASWNDIPVGSTLWRIYNEGELSLLESKDSKDGFYFVNEKDLTNAHIYPQGRRHCSEWDSRTSRIVVSAVKQ